MNKRRGASLLNVMIFLMFAMMVTAQVFFFAKSSADSVAEQREMMMYRMNLDSLVEEAKDALKRKATDSDGIVHNDGFSNGDLKLKFSEFYDTERDGKKIDFHDGQGEYDGTQVKLRNGEKWKADSKWTDGSIEYHATIHDLDYVFNPEFDGDDRGTYIEHYGNTKAHKKVFAAMPSDKKPETDEYGKILHDGEGKIIYTDEPIARYYLIRAWVELPENFFSRKLMYQVLVRRNNEDEDNKDKEHELKTLSFQEVWF